LIIQPQMILGNHYERSYRRKNFSAELTCKIFVKIVYLFIR